jgi:hypothetical protein
MNSRFLLNSILGLGCAALILAVAFQAQTTVSLQTKERALRSQMEAQSLITDTTPALATETNASALSTSELTDRQVMELMRLRNETAQLRKQRRELDSATAESILLRNRMATNTPGKGLLPPGYTRKRDAQFAGAGTPEAALQSFLYAIAKRDTHTLYQVIGGEFQRQFNTTLQADNVEKFWNEVEALPGARVIKSTARSDTEIVLDVEFLPGMDAQPLIFIKSGSDWKLTR